MKIYAPGVAWTHTLLVTPGTKVCTKKASLLPKHFSPQLRSRLVQERSVKLDAFQRIEELQSQLNDAERLSVQMSSPGGKHVPYSS